MIGNSRKITNSGGRKIIGNFASQKTGRMIRWESQLERDYIYHLELDPNVINYVSQPKGIEYKNKDGKTARYTPDFWIQRSSCEELVEVKPKEKTMETEFMEKIKLIGEVVKDAGYKYVIRNEHTGISGNCLNPIIQEVSCIINDPKPSSKTTLYRWVKEYKEKEENIIALVPDTGNRGNRTSRLMQEVQMIMHDVVYQHYMQRHRPSVVDTYQFLVDGVDKYNKMNNSIIKLPIPSIDALYRFIDSLDKYEVFVARYGKKYADMHMTQYMQGVRAKQILERVEMDHAYLPIMVVHDETRLPLGRPYLTAAIDAYSRSIVGFYLSFEPPSLLSIVQCLKHAVLPKNYIKNIEGVSNDWNVCGIPVNLVVDNGKEFKSSEFLDACFQLAINVQYAPPKTPWFKPAIERYFGTLNKRLLLNQPGTTFCNIFEKKDYDPVKNAVISYDEMLEIVHIFIVDIYQQERHRGINMIPALAWDKSAQEYPPTIPDNIDELNVVLGRVDYRTVSAKGIEFEGILYNCPELIRLRTRPHTGEKIKIKYNPSDMNVIYAYDEEAKGFIAVPSTNPDYTENLSLWQHKVCKRFTKEQYGTCDQVKLAQSRVRIANIVYDGFLKSKTKTKQKISRWMGIGILSTAEEVDKKRKHESHKETRLSRKINDNQKKPQQKMNFITLILRMI